MGIEKIDFIANHIPEMVCHLDPNFLCSSTKTTRQFLGLPTDSFPRLRIIAFRRLVPIRKLNEKHMLCDLAVALILTPRLYL